MKVKVLFKINQPPIVINEIKSVNTDLVRGLVVLYPNQQRFFNYILDSDLVHLHGVKNTRYYTLLIEDILDYTVYEDDEVIK